MSADAQSGSLTELNYGLDDVPKPIPKAIGLGLQHVLTMFGATVAVPFIIGPALGLDLGQLAILISAVFICSALATIIQVMWGTRLPIVQGVSFAFLGPFFGLAAAYQGEDALRYIAGGIMAGAVVEMLVGFGGVGKLLRKYVTPITIAPVIALIGLSLYDPAQQNASGNWWVAFATLGLIIVFSLILAPRIRAFALFPTLLAVVGMYLLLLVLSLAGVIPEGDPIRVGFDVVRETDWFRGFEIGGGGLIFPWGTPLFDLGFFFAIIAAYLASTIESFGDYHAISRIVGKGDPDAPTINRGIGMEGVGCFLTGILGGLASTSYSENIGLVGLTKVASRVVVLIGAAALLFLGLIGKIGAVIATIPTPVVGGIYLALFGLIAAVGLSNLRRADMDSQRNLMIVGVVLFMGLAVPAYVGGLDPEWNLWGQDWLGDLVRSIGGSGISVAAVLGLLLDNLVPGTDEERGVGTYDLGTTEPVVPPDDMKGM